MPEESPHNLQAPHRKATQWPEQETVDDDFAGCDAGDDAASSRSTGRPTTTGASVRRDWRHYRNSSRRSTGSTFTSFTCGRSTRMRCRSIVTHGWPGSIIEQLKIIDPSRIPPDMRAPCPTRSMW